MVQSWLEAFTPLNSSALKLTAGYGGVGKPTAVILWRDGGRSLKNPESMQHYSVAADKNRVMRETVENSLFTDLSLTLSEQVKSSGSSHASSHVVFPPLRCRMFRISQRPGRRGGSGLRDLSQVGRAGGHHVTQKEKSKEKARRKRKERAETSLHVLAVGIYEETTNFPIFHLRDENCQTKAAQYLIRPARRVYEILMCRAANQN